MNTHLVFNGIDAEEKARLQTSWEQKLPRLKTLLSPYREELLEIGLAFSLRKGNSRSDAYDVRAVIHLPTGTLAAAADGKDPLVALDRVADALVTEIKRHKELVRRDFISKRRSRDRENLSAAGPILQRDAEQGRRGEFFQRLRPHLRSLRTYVRRELRILEIQGLLHRGEVTADDVLDEVLSQAWQRFADRPRHLRLDLWFTDLVNQTLERWIKQEPRRHASLEEKVREPRPDEVPRSDEGEWWAPLLDEEETLTLGDLIPDVHATEAWEQLDAEEQTERILSLLAELPSDQRHASLLHALEDYSVAEIASLQGRPEGEVRADIKAARKTLRDRLLAGGHARVKGEMATASAAVADASGD